MSSNAVSLKRLAAVMPSNIDKHSVEDERPVSLCNYVDVYKNERITDAIDFMEATATDAQIARFTLQAHDVLVTKDSEEPTDIGIPAYVPEAIPGVVCGYHLAVIRPEPGRLHGAYLHWALQSAEVQTYYATTATGISRYALGIRDLGMTPIHLPSLTDQERIANFLDEKTARIDALIAEKERLVERLDEYQRAKVTALVTRGMNPPASLKKANAAWLGRVPAHWRESTVRRACKRVTDGAHIAPDTSSEEHPFVSTVDVADGRIGFDACLRVTTECYEYLRRTGCMPLPNDVLFSKDGTIGRTAVVPAVRPDFVVASSLVILSPKTSEVLPEFLDYWLNNDLLKQHVELQLAGAALRRVSVEKISRLPILLPPLTEQSDIVKTLGETMMQIRLLCKHVRAHIDSLREYRSSLISAAVTGRLSGL